MHRSTLPWFFVFSALACANAEVEGTDVPGGPSDGGAGTGTGGSTVGTGGFSPSTGGESAVATGGTTATGGSAATGGTTATGGATATGGGTSTGGTTATGGTDPGTCDPPSGTTCDDASFYCATQTYANGDYVLARCTVGTGGCISGRIFLFECVGDCNSEAAGTGVDQSTWGIRSQCSQLN